MKSSVLASVVVAGLAIRVCAAGNPTGSTIYDADPKHLWNRLNQTLFERTASDGKKFGLDELDVLYWHTTRHLLTEPSHREALAVMDEFIQRHGENLIRDPLKRALLQRDLWELFDWSAKPFRRPEDARPCRELELRLATLIRRLALTTNEIAAMPDNYVQAESKHLPDLPQGLLQTNGGWVSIGPPGYGDEPVAPTHVTAFDGHSAFGVRLHTPGGPKAALDYLDQLRRFKQYQHVWVYHTNRFRWVSTEAPDDVLELNPNLPQFEPLTEWALVRRMCVIASDGTIQPTPVTESIQVRRYLRTDKSIPDSRFHTNDVQQFLEFDLDKRQNGALREIGREEKGFPFVHFMGKGIDLFEGRSGNPPAEPKPHASATLQGTLLNHCFECHSSPGIYSVLSYTGFLSAPPTARPADLTPVDLTQEARGTLSWKPRQYDWGLLQGLWLQNQ